jgi:outer membrane protein OmpA-like peptidoglycan-associated protein
MITWVIIVALIAVAYKYTVGSWVNEKSQHQKITAQLDELAAVAKGKNITIDLPPTDADIDTLKAAVANIKLALTGAKPLAQGRQASVSLALDAFSGYCVLRSDSFLEELKARGINLNIKDDGADYVARFKALADGSTPMAVFTIDALLKASSERNSMPATVVMLIDETIGADAMLAYKKAVPDVDALNRKDARFVLTPDSPSETLCRVVQASFDLSSMTASPWVTVNGAAEVFKAMQADNGTKPNAYVLWEPYVSKALELPGVHILVDSSRFSGYIVDVLAVNRDYLLAHEDVVQAVVEAYSRSLYEAQQSDDGMAQLILQDARAAGEPISIEQARVLAKKIWFKNTQENYAHMGLLGMQADSLQPMDRIIAGINRVLKKTHALDNTSTTQPASSLYYDGILRKMQAGGFHPAIIKPLPGKAAENQQAMRQIAVAGPLNEVQWAALTAVGTLGADTIVFARGTATLTPSARRELDDLAQVLANWPQYYLSLTGSARDDGDMQANRQLAVDRAQAAADYLISRSVAQHRVHVAGTEPQRSDGKAQTVRFVVKQVPF